MKCLVLAFLFVSLQGSINSPKAGYKSGEQSQQSTKQKQTVATPAPSQASANTPDQNAQRTKDQSQNNEVKVTALPREIEIKTAKDAIDKTVLGCTIVLTFIGIAGTVVAVKTLFAIKRQADIMEEHREKLEQLASAAGKNADAALLNARSVILSERARLIAEMEPLPKEYQEGSALRVVCRLTNVGRTPLWITVKGEQKDILERNEFPPPTYPIFREGKVTRFQGKGAILAPKGSLIVLFYLLIGEPRPVYCGDKSLWIYGFVEYRDTFDALHEMRYCFCYFPQLGGSDPATSGFYMEGPPVYNQEIDVEQTKAQ